MVEDKIVFKKLNEIRPYVRNPRRNEKTVDLLCQLIPKVGFNVPLVIDEKGIIVKGHARYAAAIRLGMDEVPCIITHADAEAVKADRITDNKISEFSEWINDEVLQEIENINTDIDFGALGFPSVKFDEMPDEQEVKQEIEDAPAVGGIQIGQTETPPVKIKVPKKYYKCVCPDCGHVMFIEEGQIKSRKGA